MAEREVAADAVGEPIEGPVGPPAGFGREVHDYLSHYVSVADAKAGAIVAAGIALAAVAASAKEMWTCDLALVAAALLIASMLIAVFSLFPRQPSGGGSVIFWMDILGRDSIERYRAALGDFDEREIEAEYARQNFTVSGVLKKKFAYVQVAILLWGSSVGVFALAAWSLRG